METDFLVIGAGVAGLSAAIEAAAAGRVLVLTKDRLTESATEYLQGGVAVALSDEDEVGLHEQDTLLAGAGLCYPQAVRTLVEAGPKRIQKLIEWGAEFDTDGLVEPIALQCQILVWRNPPRAFKSTGPRHAESLRTRLAACRRA